MRNEGDTTAQHASRFIAPTATQKGAFVKVLNHIPWVPSSTSAVSFQKPTARGRTSEYYLKSYSKRDKPPDPYLSTVEAVGAELMRLVFSPSYTPKVRVVTLRETSSDARPNVISKKINFKTINKLTENFFQFFNKQQRGIIKLMLTIFCFEESDLHKENCGIDHANEIVKIDHDCLFGDFSNQLLSESEKFHGETSEEFLLPWPNLLYPPKDMFAIISEEDVVSLPRFHVTKPWNHPLDCFFDKSARDTQYEALSYDSEIIKWKYFYLTKYLVLLTLETVHLIIRDHSVGSDEKDKEFESFILTRRQKIENVLLHIPEYYRFLKNVMSKQDMMNEFYKEIAAFNETFFDKQGHPKPHKQYRVLNVRKISETLNALIQTAERVKELDAQYPELWSTQKINIGIAKVKRETEACHRLVNGLQQQIQVLQELDIEVNHLQHIPYNAKKISLDRFAQKYIYKPRKFSNDASLPMIIEYIKTRLTQHRQFLENKIKTHFNSMIQLACCLIQSKCRDLSKNDLCVLWQLIESTKNDVSVIFFIMHATQYIALQKIPNIVFDWLINHQPLSAELVSLIYQNVTSHAVLKNLHEFIVTLQKISGNAGPASHTIVQIDSASNLYSKATDLKNIAKKLLQLFEQENLQIQLNAYELMILSEVINQNIDALVCLSSVQTRAKRITSAELFHNVASRQVPSLFSLTLTNHAGKLQLDCKKI